MSAAFFNNSLIVRRLLDNFIDDIASLTAVMLISRTTANEAIPRLWTTPSLVALAKVSAAHRPVCAVSVRIIHLDATITHDTAATLHDIAFPRVQKLVVDGVPGDIEPALVGVTSLTALRILDRARSPAVLAVLSLMLPNDATLTIVHLRCAITDNDLAQLARLRRLEDVALLGPLPPGAKLREAAARITHAATNSAAPLWPFARLASVAVAATAGRAVAVLKLLADACAIGPADGAAATVAGQFLRLDVDFCDTKSVDLAVFVSSFSGEGLQQAISLRPRLLLSTLRLKFLGALHLRQEHIMALAALPSTLLQLSIDTHRATGHLAATDLTAFEIGQLVQCQPQLRSLHLELLMPMAGVNTLNWIGHVCRQLRCLFVSGAFQLDLLATCTCLCGTFMHPVGIGTRSSLTYAYALFEQPGPATGRADDAAAGARPPLFPELRSLVLESTLPVCEGVSPAVLSVAISKARGRGEHDVQRIRREQIDKVNTAAAKRVLVHLMRQAPQLEYLRMLHDGKVNYFINYLWQQMHPGGLAKCGPQQNCAHI